jgi:hypothetical protein
MQSFLESIRDLIKNTWKAFKKLKWWGKTIVILFLLGLLGSCGGESDPTPKKVTPPVEQENQEPVKIEVPAEVKPVYSFKLEGSEFVNPATIKVFYTVTNTNNVSGTANCEISVRDESSTYRGFDIYEVPVLANQTVQNASIMTVTNEGAAYITNGEIVCEG